MLLAVGQSSSYIKSSCYADMKIIYNSTLAGCLLKKQLSWSSAYRYFKCLSGLSITVINLVHAEKRASVKCQGGAGPLGHSRSV